MTDRVRCADCGKELTVGAARPMNVWHAGKRGSAAWEGPELRWYCQPRCAESVVKGTRR